MRIASMIIAGALSLTGAGVAPDDSGKEFTACMREHGLPDFPDATISSDGRINLAEGVWINPFSKEYQAALTSCTSLLPGETTLPQVPDLPKLDLCALEAPA